MYILYSTIVIIILLVIGRVFVTRAIDFIRAVRNKDVTWRLALSLFLALCIALPSFVFLGDYTYPFERTLHPKLIAEVDVPERFKARKPGDPFWHGAYQAYGLCASSVWFDPYETQSKYGFAWPPMDYAHHNYIITYGQKIKSLSYNVWDMIYIPIRTGAKVGHMRLEETFIPEKVYIYQIPKVRIENDINNHSNPWD